MAKKERASGSINTALWIKIGGGAIAVAGTLLGYGSDWAVFKASAESVPEPAIVQVQSQSVVELVKAELVKAAAKDRKDIREQTVKCMIMLTKTATILDVHVKEGIEDRVSQKAFLTEYREGRVKQETNIEKLQNDVQALTVKIGNLHQ